MEKHDNESPKTGSSISPVEIGDLQKQFYPLVEVLVPLKDDLDFEVTKIFKDAWTTRSGNVVPTDASLKLGNDGIELEATVLYADMAESTKLVDRGRPKFAAEIYKAFLHTSAKIIKSMGGEITAYDGDRIMAVFIGDYKNTRAVKSALKINWARQFLIQPKMKSVYSDTDYVFRHTVGIDTSKLLVAKTGVRGSNDLVWVGRAANWAAKLCNLGSDFPTWITKAVYDMIADDAKLTNGVNMWEARTWTSMNGASIYRSNWHWKI